MTQRKFIVIAGPTASGKTAISVGVAKALGSPVISADSMQIYRGCDIGTAKIRPEETKGIPHYMIDIADPGEDYSVARYQQDAFTLIEKFNSQGSLPIVTGGTGLYINSLVYSLDFGGYRIKDKIRQNHTYNAGDNDSEYLYNILKQRDPEYAVKISPQDRRRILRRLELIDIGRAGEYDFRKPNDSDSFIIIGLTMPRDVLYRRIEQRVDEMMTLGLEHEARKLLSQYPGSNAAKAIGYKEFASYFSQEATLEQTVNLIKRNTRRYAKRQMTWFNRDERIKWFDVSTYKCLEDIINGIMIYVNRKGF